MNKPRTMAVLCCALLVVAGTFAIRQVAAAELSDKQIYINHRGNHHKAPENSIPAFEQADHFGAETDIHVTKDGHWVIMHDETVDRMTDGTGRIVDLTLEEVRKLRIDKGPGAEDYPAEKMVVPTLEEYLDACAQAKAVPIIEIKCQTATSADFDKLKTILEEKGMADKAWFISFYFENLAHMHKRMPEVPTMLLTPTLDDNYIKRVAHLGEQTGVDVMYKHPSVNAENVAKLLEKGYFTGAWIVPPDEFANLEEMGMVYMTSDF